MDGEKYLESRGGLPVRWRGADIMSSHRGLGVGLIFYFVPTELVLFISIFQGLTSLAILFPAYGSAGDFLLNLLCRRLQSPV